MIEAFRDESSKEIARSHFPFCDVKVPDETVKVTHGIDEATLERPAWYSKIHTAQWW